MKTHIKGVKIQNDQQPLLLQERAVTCLYCSINSTVVMFIGVIVTKIVGEPLNQNTNPKLLLINFSFNNFKILFVFSILFFYL